MYIPNAFAETDQTKLHNFIQKHSFATLITQYDNEPFASHLPLLLEPDAGSHGTVIGHMARANPQWRQLEGQTVLSIFHGPHTYVSPRWYEPENLVPTWNYVAVHVYGTVQLETDQDHLLNSLKKHVGFFESNMPQPWSMEQTDPNFIEGLLGSIVGFKIEIDRMEGKWKLNQNHNSSRREKVIQALRKSETDDSIQIAELMSQTLNE